MNIIMAIIRDFSGYCNEIRKDWTLRLKELKTTLWGMIYDDVLTFAKTETRALTERPEMPNWKEFPEDLQDRQGLMNLTADGYAVSGRLTINDLKYGSLSPAQYPLMGVYLTFFYFMGITFPIYLGSIFGSLFLIGLLSVITFIPFLVFLRFSGIASNVGKIVVSIIYIVSAIMLPVTAIKVHLTLAFVPVFVGAVVPLLINWFERKDRRDELLKATDDGAVLRADFGLKEAKQEQLKETKKDKTPFIHFGKSLGVLRHNGDRYAPDKGMPMGFTAKDARQHMIITGKTGSGKTFNGFRPYAKQWIEKGCGGAVIMDGKGQLAADLAKKIPEINLVDPDHLKIAPLQGLKGEEAALGIMDTMLSDPANSSEWDGWAEELLRYSAVLLEAAKLADPDIGWTITNVRKVYTIEQYRQFCASKVKELAAKQPLDQMYRDAGEYFKHIFPAFPERQRASIVSHVNLWLGPFFQKREIRSWANLEEGIDITKVLQGEVYGLCLPKTKYGLAGVAITNLAKLRIYNAAQLRGENWEEDPDQTACLMIIDEAQEVLTGIDEGFPAIARGFGVALCIGTQNIEQLVERFKKKTEDNAWGVIEQFCSFMTFKASKTTYNHFSDRIGDSRLLTSRYKQTALDYDVCLNQIAASPMADPNHPEKRALRKNRSIVFETLKGKTKETFQAILPGQPTEEEQQGERPQKELEYKPIVEQHDLTDVLAIPYTCLASFSRAKVDRRDFVKCEYQVDA